MKNTIPVNSKENRRKIITPNSICLSVDVIFLGMSKVIHLSPPHLNTYATLQVPELYRNNQYVIHIPTYNYKKKSDVYRNEEFH